MWRATRLPADLGIDIWSQCRSMACWRRQAIDRLPGEVVQTMRPHILILTEADDVHAIAVGEALRLRGAEPTVWATSDFPTRSEETIHFAESPQSTLRIEAPHLSLSDPKFDVVWRRRPAFVLDPDALHPADRAFAESECSVFRRSLMNLLAPQAFWVNPLPGVVRAGSKIMQHQAAVSVGLRMPETLYTNSPHEVRAFIRRKSGSVIYKPFLPTGWSDGARRYLPYTALLSDDSLIDESLRLTPGIFQELVPKAYEVRLTMIGRRAFAAKVLSQETVTGKLDWRQAPDELAFEPTTVPRAIEEQCVALLEELGLVFGCLDFIVTPAGDYVFLEINEMGQFLFVERCCGLPLLDAFVSFLLQATTDFDWSAEEVSVRYPDPEFEAVVLAESQRFARAHVAVPERLVEEPKSVAKS